MGILVVDAFHRYAVLVFPEQALDDEQQIAFSRRFGSLETSLRTTVAGAGPTAEDGKPLRA